MRKYKKSTLKNIAFGSSLVMSCITGIALSFALGGFYAIPAIALGLFWGAAGIYAEHKIDGWYEVN